MHDDVRNPRVYSGSINNSNLQKPPPSSLSDHTHDADFLAVCKRMAAVWRRWRRTSRERPAPKPQPAKF
jgi:hypothetical protein